MTHQIEPLRAFGDQPLSVSISAEERHNSFGLGISAPLYGLLRKQLPKLSFREIDDNLKLFSKEFPNGGEIEAMQNIARQYGLQLQHIRLDSHRPNSIPSPCLLLVSKSGRVGSDMLVLLVEATGPTGLQVFDINRVKSRGVLLFNELPISWGGDVLVLEKSSHLPFILSVILTTTLVYLVIRYSRRMSLRTAAVKLVVLIAIAAIFSGCQDHIEQRDLGIPPLQVVGAPVRDLGEIISEDNRAVPFRVELDVVSNSAIRITNISGDCSCIIGGKDLLNKVIKRGERVAIDSDVNVHGRAGEQFFIMTIQSQTENGDSLAPVKFGVRYFVQPSPKLETNAVDLSWIEGDTVAQNVLNVFLIRRPNQMALTFDQARQLNTAIRVQQVGDTISTPVSSNGQLVRDVITLQIESANPRADDSDEILDLYFVGYEKPQTVEVNCRIRPIIEIYPSRIFLGTVRPDETHTREVIVSLNRTSDGLEPPQIDAQQCKNIGNITITPQKVSSQGATFLVRFEYKSPALPGRFEESILFLDCEKSQKKQQFFISGIITE